MIVEIFNFDTKEQLFEFKFKSATKDFVEVEKEINRRQEQEDILHVGSVGNVCLGIKSWFNTPFGFSTMSADGGIIKNTGRNSCIIGISNVDTPENVKIDGKNTKLRIGIVASLEGYVINSGKVSYNIFGVRNKSYFSKITSRNFKCSSKAESKHFATPAAIIKYLSNDHIDTFKYMVKNYGYSFSVEYASEAFENTKKSDKDINDLEKVNAILSEINGETAAEEQVVFGNTPEEEAVRRMTKLKLDTRMVIKPFIKTGKIFQSEAGGILYDTDENCCEAIDCVRRQGGTPYHVCVSNTEFGKCYAVLYVSGTKENWEVEGPDKDGVVSSYVYNIENDKFSEYGDIVVSPANGGLVRTA